MKYNPQTVMEEIECQECGWRGNYDDLISPTSDHEPGCPDCLSTDMVEIEFKGVSDG